MATSRMTERSTNVQYIVEASRTLTPSEIEAEIARYIRENGQPAPGSIITIYSSL
jgi:hypothetical protein